MHNQSDSMPPALPSSIPIRLRLSPRRLPAERRQTKRGQTPPSTPGRAALLVDERCLRVLAALDVRVAFIGATGDGNGRGWRLGRGFGGLGLAVLPWVVTVGDLGGSGCCGVGHADDVALADRACSDAGSEPRRSGTSLASFL